ncbi:MAG: hypothetical protein GY842_19865, partial [bacterium]|nr:hypothetical protein [bacterium]
RNCLAAGVIPEINTSSLRQGLTDPMPGEAVVRRYAELGGRMIALGSDAHLAESIGAGLEQAAALSKRCGIEQLAVFKNGAPIPVPLSSRGDECPA